MDCQVFQPLLGSFSYLIIRSTKSPSPMKTTESRSHWQKFPYSIVLNCVICLAANAQPPMPQAITISPEDATGTDTIILTLDIRKACIPEKSLPFTGQEILYMSGAALRPWDSRAQGDRIMHLGDGADLTPPTMTPNGDSTWSIRFQPAGYFNVHDHEIKALSLDFADTNQQRQVFDYTPYGCERFYIPLRTNPPIMDTLGDGTIIEAGGLFKENTFLDFETIRVVDHLHIELGTTLTIAPGCLVEFQDNFVVNVLGTLIAEGTETDSIVFTAKDPATGWMGFWFKHQADRNTSRISYSRLTNMKTEEGGQGLINAEYYPGLSIAHSVITRNDAHGIYLSGSNILLDHTTISYNGKGGVHSDASHPDFLNCRIVNNNSHGVFLNLSDPTFVNCIISNNEADALELTAADPRLVNCIVAKNGGLTAKMEISNPRFINSILWENNGGISMTDPTSGILLRNCIYPDFFPEGEQMDQIILREPVFPDADPMFINPPWDQGISPQALTADWTVPMQSVAVNNGTIDIEGFEVPPTDLGGKDRISYGVIDIGPHEFSQPVTSLSIDQDVTGNAIWMADTVKILNDIRVHDGAILTIAPDTRVEFQGHYQMIVEGCLIANGAEGHEIRFTVGDTAGYYNPDTTLGTWAGLFFQTFENPASVINHCIFEYSSDLDGEERNGGAIEIADHSSPYRISDCLFQYNYAEGQGGAIFIHWAGPEIIGNEFRYNKSIEGGAIHTSPTSSAKIRDNYIHHNHAHAFGGGIYSSGAAIIEKNRIGYNGAGIQGGGIFCCKSKAMVIHNLIYNNRFGGLAAKDADPFIAGNLIVNNAADAGLFEPGGKREGSGIFIDLNCDATILNNTICNNLCSQYRGSSVRLFSNTCFINNIVWGNRDLSGNPSPVEIEGAIAGDITHCIVEGGTAGIRIGNPEYEGIVEMILDSLPQCVDPTEGPGTGFDGSQADWNIIALSPAINNGAPYQEDIFRDYRSDYLGFQRNTELYDIGAYEHQSEGLGIFSQPVDIVACDGDTAVFFVMANDTAYYQWYRNEQILGGAVNPELEIMPVDQEDEGIYFCRVWNAYGQKISEPSFLIVNHPPEIFVQPENEWMVEGLPVVMEVRAEGSPPMHYQWFQDYHPIETEGADQPKLVFPESGSWNEGLYYCTIENSCGTVSTDSIRLFLAPQICMVTVDTASKNNLVIWEKKSSAPIESYNVYRESIVAGQYEILDNVPASELSVYVDTGANPAEQAYIYKITGLDPEGNESDIDRCKPHKTIHLLTSLSTEHGVVQLDWDHYYGFKYGTYYIYRSVDNISFNILEQKAASSTTYTDLSAIVGQKYHYRVEVQSPEPCSPTRNGVKAGVGPYEHSLSNLDDNKLKTGTLTPSKHGTLTIYPNPMQDLARILFPNPGNERYDIYLRELSGKTVRHISGVTGNEFLLQREDLKPGVYILEFRGPDSFRGKLIVK